MSEIKNKSSRVLQNSNAPPKKLLKLDSPYIAGTNSFKTSSSTQSPHISSSIVHSTKKTPEFKITHPTTKGRASAQLSPEFKIREENSKGKTDKSRSPITQFKRYKNPSSFGYENENRFFEHEMVDKNTSNVFASDASTPMMFDREPEYINTLEKENIWDKEYFNNTSNQNSDFSVRQIPTSSLYSYSYQDNINSFQGNFYLLIIPLFIVLYSQ